MEDEHPQHLRQDPQQPSGQPLPIEDQESWFRNNTLRHRPIAERRDSVEERQRVRNYEAYQQQVHDTIFANEEAKEFQKQQQRAEQLKPLKEGLIVFHAADGTFGPMPLFPFAESCETILTLATTIMRDESDDGTVVCQLIEYPMESVKFFVRILGEEGHGDGDIDTDHLVDCCSIASYLQCDKVFSFVEDILLNSIDTANCLSICSLADRFCMNSVFEKALNHMMHTLGDTRAYWNDLTPELRERITVIKAAIQSSFHSQRSKLYFNSVEEYISIFAERVEYYRERLADAKDQMHLIEPGTKLWIDTAMKIKKQEERVKTLKTALNEQKKLFTNQGKGKFSFVVPPSSEAERAKPKV